MYIIHFYCLTVEAGFYSDIVESLPLDPAAQVRFPSRAVGIFLHPVTLIYGSVAVKTYISINPSYTNEFIQKKTLEEAQWPVLRCFTRD